LYCGGKGNARVDGEGEEGGEQMSGAHGGGGLSLPGCLRGCCSMCCCCSKVIVVVVVVAVDN